MKYLPLLFLLLSFGVKGQDTMIKSQFPPMGYWAGDTSVKPIFFGEPDRNPNDFYDSAHTHDRLICYRCLTEKGWYQIELKNTSTAKQLSLEEKLLMYASECWNDSALSFGETWFEYESDSVFVQGRYVEAMRIKEAHYKYIHREPTFEGFIEYLKKK